MNDESTRTLRLGFLGLGWIGRHRLGRLVSEAGVEVAAVCDPDADALAELGVSASRARVVSSPEELARLDLDGAVIATPSALHAEQAIRCLEAGLPVFCQKPLGRNEQEVASVVAAAEKADRLLGVDVTYRGLPELVELRRLVASGALGDIYGIDLVFHNAYGPQGGWFRDYSLSGGGCLADLGVHLIDMLGWCLGWPTISWCDGHRSHQGRAVQPGAPVCEDYAIAHIGLRDGTVARLACSWDLSEGTDARIVMTLYGTESAGRVENIEGSFISFRALHLKGTSQELVSETREDFSDWRWGGNVAVQWARRLREDPSFDADIRRAVEVAAVVDRMYGRAKGRPCGSESALVPSEVTP